MNFISDLYIFVFVDYLISLSNSSSEHSRTSLGMRSKLSGISMEDFRCGWSINIGCRCCLFVVHGTCLAQDTAQYNSPVIHGL